MSTLSYIVLSTFLLSSASLIGVFTLSLKTNLVKKYLIYLVSLSAGTLIGSAFLHLLPEAAEELDILTVSQLIIASYATFFFIEKVLHFHHHHHAHEHGQDKKELGYINLFADAIHNFIDGMVIATTFMVDIKLGIATTLAVALHEIPQEIGDFGVLLYAGFSRKKALLANFFIGLTAIFGGVLGYYLSGQVEHLVSYLLPLAAGSFIYIAASDLMPELKKEDTIKNSAITFIVFLLGIGIMVLLKD